jgi:hypothetical protein
MRSLLAILLFFAPAEPAAACRRFSIWHYNFPQTLSDRSPGGSSRGCAVRARYAPARPYRNHLGRNRRREARRDRNAARLKRRSLDFSAALSQAMSASARVDRSSSGGSRDRLYRRHRRWTIAATAIADRERLSDARRQPGPRVVDAGREVREKRRGWMFYPPLDLLSVFDRNAQIPVVATR